MRKLHLPRQPLLRSLWRFPHRPRSIWARTLSKRRRAGRTVRFRRGAAIWLPRLWSGILCLRQRRLSRSERAYPHAERPGRHRKSRAASVINADKVNGGGTNGPGPPGAISFAEYHGAWGARLACMRWPPR